MPQTLFDTADQATPFTNFAPTWAYIVAVVFGPFFPLGLGIATLFGWLWPSEKWRWGLWAALPVYPIYALLQARREGLLLGVIESLTSPAVLFYLVACCALAAWAARTKLSHLKRTETP